MKELENYYGRLFTKYQLTAKEREIAEKVPSITKKNNCFRCGTTFEEENKLPKEAGYV